MSGPGLDPILRRLGFPAILAFFDEVGDHRWFGQRRDIAEIAEIVLGDLAQDSPHDLAGASLRQSWRELNEIRRGDRADLLAHPIAQLDLERVRFRLPRHQRDVAIDALALDVVGIADHGGLRDLGMGDERGLDLGGAHAVPGDIDHVVDPAGDPVIAVGVAAAAVAR